MKKDLETSTAAPSDGAASAEDIKRFRENFQGEVDGVAIYQRLAAAEKDESRSQIFLQLAETEKRHLKIWEDKLRAAGVEPPARKPSFRVRAMAFLADRIGVRAVLPMVSAMESNGFDNYMAQADAGPAMARNERAHARTLSTMYSPGGEAASGVAGIARGESWHRVDTGGQLRAAIFGISDGLLSNLSLVIGVAGANPDGSFIVLAGVAGLLAGAFSMGAGEWISVTSQRELFERQIALEQQELEADPEEERGELELIYRAKGVPADQARALATKIIGDRDVALETLAREELGLNPEGLGSPWGVAFASFAAFAVGAVIPVIPWLFGSSWPFFVTSVVISGIAAFLVGAGVSLFTGRNPVFAGMRQVGIAAGAAAVTYGIGRAIGVNAS